MVNKAFSFRPMANSLQPGMCVKVPDGRIGRVRAKVRSQYKIRVRRKTSNSHQFLFFSAKELVAVACPVGWMSPAGYNRYVKKTLQKMQQRAKK